MPNLTAGYILYNINYLKDKFSIKITKKEKTTTNNLVIYINIINII